VAAAITKSGWPAAVSGADSDGVIDSLATETFRALPTLSKPSTEFVITPTAERYFHEAGLSALVYYKDSGVSVFPKIISCYNYRYAYASEDPSVRMLSQLPFLLCTYRVVHYLVALARDKTNVRSTAGECTHLLNDWLSRYVSRAASANAGVQARYPLADGEVESVEDVSDGSFRVLLRVAPRFLLPNLTGPIHVQFAVRRNK
jgi:predicted component of type VI protein secretion system